MASRLYVWKKSTLRYFVVSMLNGLWCGRRARELLGLNLMSIALFCASGKPFSEKMIDWHNCKAHFLYRSRCYSSPFFGYCMDVMMVRTGLAAFQKSFLMILGEQTHKEQSSPTGQADQHFHLMKKIFPCLYNPQPTCLLLVCHRKHCIYWEVLWQHDKFSRAELVM